MVGLKKLDTNNLYDKIGKVSEVDKKKKEVKKEVVNEEAKEKEKEKETASGFESLLNPEVKERKTEAIYLRVKPSVKKAFDDICKQKCISQADMFSYWVESILK